MSNDATVRRTSASGLPGPQPQDDADAPAGTVLDEFSSGDVLRERYELVKPLGRGAMGAVFLAKDLIEERYEERDPYVAIKFLGSQFAAHPQATLALEREARKARSLSHDNIVKVFYFDEYRDRPYMVMEYIRGQPLDELLRGSEGMPFEQAWPIVRDMGLGLAYIHDQRMVHSDFKPGNVFIAESGRAKILDLGIARASASSEEDVATRFDVGSLGALTPAYASCEMFERRPPDPRDDLYALGCIAYELLTGRHPFGGAWSIQARSAGHKMERVEGLLSERRWRALEKALAFDREERTPTVAEFLEQLEARPNLLRRRLAVVAIASAVVASGLAAALMPRGDPDAAFLNALLETAGARALSSEDQQRITNWLGQGADYIGFAQESFAGLDAQAGHHDLRGGADNAERAFRSVLGYTPSEEAARGILQIVNAYADGAERFAAQDDAANALWLACQGYQIHPNHVRLGRLVRSLAAGAEDFAGACRDVLRR